MVLNLFVRCIAQLSTLCSIVVFKMSKHEWMDGSCVDESMALNFGREEEQGVEMKRKGNLRN